VVLPNPRASYKAQLLDYDALLVASENSCSYCLTEREVQMLLAFVEYIAWKTRYINTETEIDHALIQAWSANLARKLMDGCCDDDKIFRFTEDGTLQSSIDGGVTWQDDPQEDPRQTATQLQPLPGADGDEKRCQASANITAHIKETADRLIADAEAWSGITGLVAALVGMLIFIGIIGSGGALTPLLIGLAGALLFAGSAAFDAAMTSTVWDDFNCIVYCNLNDDGTCTDAQLSQMVASAASEFAGIAHEFLARQLIILGRMGVINAGRTASGRTFDCSTCSCGAWCYLFDFTVSEQGWELRNTVEFGDIGRYVASVGYKQRTDFGTVDNITISSELFANRRITRVVVNYDPSLSGSNPKTTLYLSGFGTATATLGGGVSVDFTDLDVITNQVSLDIDPNYGSFEEWTGAIVSVQVEGEGGNPFGTDNCP